MSPNHEKKLLGVRQGAKESLEITAAFLQKLRESGVKTDRPTLFVLDDEMALTAPTLRVRNGMQIITDGPVAETREAPRGYSLIFARNQDDALSVAAGPPGGSGVADEVREGFDLASLP